MRPIRPLDPLPQGGFCQIEIASGRADCLPLIEDQATALALKTATPCNLSELKCFEGAQLTPAEATLAG